MTFERINHEPHCNPGPTARNRRAKIPELSNKVRVPWKSPACRRSSLLQKTTCAIHTPKCTIPKIIHADQRLAPNHPSNRQQHKAKQIAAKSHTDPRRTASKTRINLDGLPCLHVELTLIPYRLLSSAFIVFSHQGASP
jgi:hypothetical protein